MIIYCEPWVCGFLAGPWLSFRFDNPLKEFGKHTLLPAREVFKNQFLKWAHNLGEKGLAHGREARGDQDRHLLSTYSAPGPAGGTHWAVFMKLAPKSREGTFPDPVL